MSRYVPAEEIRAGNDWYRFMVSVDNQPNTLKRLQWRSRGKHDPGSGPYINRIVFGGCGHGYSDQFPRNKEVFLDGLVLQDDIADSYPSIREDGWWARLSIPFYYAKAFTFCDPPGTHPVNPQYDHWNVRITLWHFEPRWNSSHTSCRVYWGETDRRWWSYYGDFPDDWGAAKNFALQVLTDLWSYFTPPPATVYYYSSMTPYTFDGMAWSEPKFSSSLGSLAEPDASVDFFPPGVQAGLANAYVDACDKLPHTNSMNNISNAIQTATLLRDLLKGEVTELGKLKDIWLGWRYEYSTTKADIEEGAELTFRLLELTKLIGSKYIRSNGYHKVGDLICRAAIGVQFDVLGELQSFAEKWGIQLDGYNAWDMVPYSFVVDWFLHIGDILERWDSQKYALKVPVETCWLSVQRTFVNEYGFPEIFYRRLSGRPNIRCADLDWISRSPSAVTVVKRAVDVVCLL